MLNWTAFTTSDDVKIGKLEIRQAYGLPDFDLELQDMAYRDKMGIGFEIPSMMAVKGEECTAPLTW